MVTRRTFLGGCAALLPIGVQAQEYPSRPVRVIVPFPAGSSTDASARIVMEHLGTLLGQAMMIENRPGASTQLGTRDLAQAKPDGYTLGYLPDGALTIMPPARILRDPRATFYDPFSLTPISLAADSYFVLIVRADLPVSSVRELVQYAWDASLRFASGNPSGVLLLSLLNQEANVKIEHLPYWRDGEPGASVAVLSGTAHGMFASTRTALPLIATGTVKALGVPVSNPFLPGTQTLAQQGFGKFENMSTWDCVCGPPGLPRAIVQKINALLARTLNDPTIKERLEKNGLQAHPSLPEELSARITRQYEFFVRFIRENDIHLP